MSIFARNHIIGGEDGVTADKFFNDFTESNILVDFSRPTKIVPYTLWILDQ